MCDGPLGKEGRGRLLRPLGKVPTLHKKFEINRTSGFLLIIFLNVGLFRFGWEKFACFFCAQLFHTEGMDLST